MKICNIIKKNTDKLVTLTAVLAAFVPMFAAAQGTPTTFAGLVARFLQLINVLIPAVFSLTFIYIVWKVIDAWVINGGDQAKRQEGRQLVLVGVIVFVLMLVTWGAVALLRATFFSF